MNTVHILKIFISYVFLKLIKSIIQFVCHLRYFMLSAFLRIYISDALCSVIEK